jgi:hypothetical protein
MEIRGITVYGVNVLLTSEDESAVDKSPVYLPRDLIDAAIANGSLEAGALKHVRVYPPAKEWPERWRFLKE